MGIYLPTVVDSGPRGERTADLYSRLLQDRIIFMGRPIDDQVANLIVAEMLYLEANDPERDIYLYINSPGGLVLAGLAIYDVMQYVKPDVSTVCVGMAMSAAAFILAGGASGKRMALPSSKVMIHQGTAGMRGAPTDMEIHLREAVAAVERTSAVIAHHSGQPVDKVRKDMERDYFMTPEEAQRYGLIDQVIAPRRGLAVPQQTLSELGEEGGPAAPARRPDR
jgi:ATP-dependent Clp protease, protease subunit